MSAPKASECMSTRTKEPSSAVFSTMALITPARLPASAALTLKYTALRPWSSMSFTIASALGSVERMSMCTPKISKPLRASSLAVAPPKPLDAPRISAHPLLSELIGLLLVTRGPPR